MDVIATQAEEVGAILAKLVKTLQALAKRVVEGELTELSVLDPQAPPAPLCDNLLYGEIIARMKSGVKQMELLNVKPAVPVAIQPPQLQVLAAAPAMVFGSGPLLQNAPESTTARTTTTSSVGSSAVRQVNRGGSSLATREVVFDVEPRQQITQPHHDAPSDKPATTNSWNEVPSNGKKPRVSSSSSSSAEDRGSPASSSSKKKKRTPFKDIPATDDEASDEDDVESDPNYEEKPRKKRRTTRSPAKEDSEEEDDASTTTPSPSLKNSNASTERNKPPLEKVELSPEVIAKTEASLCKLSNSLAVRKYLDQVHYHDDGSVELPKLPAMRNVGWIPREQYPSVTACAFCIESFEDGVDTKICVGRKVSLIKYDKLEFNSLSKCTKHAFHVECGAAILELSEKTRKHKETQTPGCIQCVIEQESTLMKNIGAKQQ